MKLSLVASRNGSERSCVGEKCTLNYKTCPVEDIICVWCAYDGASIKQEKNKGEKIAYCNYFGIAQ
ncbi:hypothetical protein HOD96_02215 [Candidatus Falkowbacteria bacterium]|jgi:hypothetical protein|nr:hypothetical protein [Candidatus Falkowbacteria bacterium]MBT4433105.1 hypothetical protein [Candidatus Falkowbacteria bacterium]